MEIDNTQWVLTHYLKELNIPITASAIDQELQIHPLYASLLGISDVLDNWNVPNAAYQLTFEQLITDDVPTPFIASFIRDSFVLVNHITEEYVITSNEKKENQKLTAGLFKDLYGGTILIAEKSNNSGEAGYRKKKWVEVFNKWSVFTGIAGIALIFIAFLFGFSSFLKGIDSRIILLSIFKSAGLGVTIVLLMQSVNANSSVVKKLCGDDSTRNCNAILSSRAASINDWISWSEVGFFYFAGSWIVLLFNNKNMHLLQMLALISLTALPYTVYSIYYQWRVAKQWCILCCSVQAVLWLDFFAFWPFLISIKELPDAKTFLILIMDFFIPVFIWLTLKPLLSNLQVITTLKKQLRTFKYNLMVFQKIMNEQQQHQLLSEDHSIIIGDKEAEKIITIISNPYCGHCAETHKALDEWINERRDIKLQLVFSTPNTAETITHVSSHMLALKKEYDSQSIKAAISEWYDRKFKNYTIWAQNYPVIAELGANENLEVQRLWCNSTETIGTPQIFINGRKLPYSYEVKDLKYFL